MLPDTLRVIAPRHDRNASTVPTPRGFYLVGEAERSTHRLPAITNGRSSISINGRWHAMRGRTATFEQILRIAFPTQPLLSPALATVSYRGGVAGALEGLLTPGDAIPLTDGLRINASATYAS